MIELAIQFLTVAIVFVVVGIIGTKVLKNDKH